MQTEARYRWLFGALICLAALFYAAFIARSAFSIAGTRFFSLFDDGMISMRFARHLAEGHGLTWNIGEAPVEGYTNFLWTLYMAALHRLPIPLPWLSLLVMLTGVAVLVGLLAVVRTITWRLSDGRVMPTVIAVVLVAFHYPLVFWTLRGMEVGVMALFVYGAIATAFQLEAGYRRRVVWFTAVLLALALLTRPDAVVPYGLIALYLVVRLPAAKRVEAMAVLTAAFVIPVAAQTAFRRAYYHEWLPNTYYLKVTGVSVVERLTRGVKVWLQSYGYHLYPYMAVIPAVFLIKRIDPRVLLLAALVVCQSAYSIYVGGDAWEWIGAANRYVTLAAPALAILAGLGFDRVLQSAAIRSLALRLATLVVAGALAARAVLAIWPPADNRMTGIAWAVASLTVGMAGWVGARCVAGRFPAWVPTKRESIVATAVGVILMVGMANGRMLAGWGTTNAIHVHDDANASRLGLFIRETTREDAVIAVRWAGAIPYFAERTTIDLLGKSDPVIAKGPPATPEFFPGHNKWNFGHSIGTLRPDVVVQFEESASNNADMARWGYVRLNNGIWVRRDTERIEWDTIGRDWRDPTVLESLLPPR